MIEGEVEFKDLPVEFKDLPEEDDRGEVEDIRGCVEGSHHVFLPHISLCMCSTLERGFPSISHITWAVAVWPAERTTVVEVDHSARTVRCPICEQPFSPKGLKIHQGMTRHYVYVRE